MAIQAPGIFKQTTNVIHDETRRSLKEAQEFKSKRHSFVPCQMLERTALHVKRIYSKLGSLRVSFARIGGGGAAAAANNPFGAGGFGGGGSMNVDPNTAMQMLQNPQMQQMMNQMLQNPEMMNLVRRFSRSRLCCVH